MFSTAMFRELFAHMEWADATTWTVLLGNEAAMDDAIVRRTVVHLHSAQQGFFTAWTGRPLQFRDPSDFPNMASVYAWAMPYYSDVRAFIAGLDDQVLEEPRRLPWTAPFEQQLGRQFAQTTFGDTLYQVIAHSNHHRGQIQARLRHLGAEPQIVDYIAWVWFERPAAAWPASVNL